SSGRRRRRPTRGHQRRKAVQNLAFVILVGEFGPSYSYSRAKVLGHARYPSPALQAPSPLRGESDWLWVAPGMASLGEQFVGRHRAPGSSRIEFLCAQRPAGPGGADRVNDPPGGFDFVAPNEERRI